MNSYTFSTDSWLTEVQEGVCLHVLVRTRARQNRVMGTMNGYLMVDLNALPKQSPHVLVHFFAHKLRILPAQIQLIYQTNKGRQMIFIRHMSKAKILWNLAR